MRLELDLLLLGSRLKETGIAIVGLKFMNAAAAVMAHKTSTIMLTLLATIMTLKMKKDTGS